MEVLFGDQCLFIYDKNPNSLVCPRCNRTYGFNNRTLYKKFLDIITEQKADKRVVLETILFRCIYCDLYDHEYPFKCKHTFIPNEEQENIIVNLYQEIVITANDCSLGNVFVLEAQAGTGKTSTIMHLFKYPEFRELKVCFSAPTNKALNVMTSKINDIFEDTTDENEIRDGDNDVSERHNASFLTLFKLLSGNVSINYLGETKFKANSKSNDLVKFDVVVIDEASMIESNEVTIILECIKSLCNSQDDTRIPVVIFLGDRAQLPPVKESNSPIFDDAIHQKYHIKKLSLSKIMRSQNQLTTLSHNVRDLTTYNPTSGPDISYLDIKKYSNVDVTLNTSRDKWVSEYCQLYKKNMNTLPPVMLVYTNAECESLNNACRNIIFNNPSDQYVIGEMVVFKNYYIVNKQYKKNNKIVRYLIYLYTSDHIIVKNVTICEYIIPEMRYSYLIQDVSGFCQLVEKRLKKLVRPSELALATLKLEGTLNKWSISGPTITTHDTKISAQLNQLMQSINNVNHVYQTNLLYFNDSRILKDDTEPDNAFITIIDSSDINKYTTNCDAIKTIIKYNYRYIMDMCTSDINRAIIDTLFSRLWKLYYQFHVWKFADISYGYALTTHKSQGSTYGHVFVNVSNILGCKKVTPVVRARSLYTAMTRASDTVHILNSNQIITPIIDSNAEFTCEVCKHIQTADKFNCVNYSIDTKCINTILSSVTPNSVIYDNNGVYVYGIDKDRIVYKINSSEFTEKPTYYDILAYIISHRMSKYPICAYTMENLNLIREITK